MTMFRRRLLRRWWVTNLLEDLRGMQSEDIERRDEEIARLEAMLAVTLDCDTPDGEN